MDVLTIAAIGMQNDLQRMGTISQNLANVTTPGYKKQVSVMRAFGLEMAALQSPTPSSGDLQSLGMGMPLSIDASAGPLRPSSNLQDIAIEGDSFFEVATPEGPAYTRQGALRIDLKGMLVGNQGLPIMGSGGEIGMVNAPFTVAANGDILQAGRTVSRIRRVRFDKPAQLAPVGNGMYAQGGARVLDAQSDDPVRVGFQEGSNVSSPQEMVRLTETVRHFEALQKIVQGYDESLEKAIRKLGDF